MEKFLSVLLAILFPLFSLWAPIILVRLLDIPHRLRLCSFFKIFFYLCASNLIISFALSSSGSLILSFVVSNLLLIPPNEFFFLFYSDIVLFCSVISIWLFFFNISKSFLTFHFSSPIIPIYYFGLFNILMSYFTVFYTNSNT